MVDSMSRGKQGNRPCTVCGHSYTDHQSFPCRGEVVQTDTSGNQSKAPCEAEWVTCCSDEHEGRKTQRGVVMILCHNCTEHPAAGPEGTYLVMPDASPYLRQPTAERL
jgi:hypothetical protein